MIVLSLVGKQIYIKFRSIQGAAFNQAVAAAKSIHCGWNDVEKVWTVSANRYAAVYDAFSDIDLLKQEYELKTQILIGIINGFSLERYWAAKAKASMNEDTGNKRKTAKTASKATKKTVRKTKTNKQKNKIT